MRFLEILSTKQNFTIVRDTDRVFSTRMAIDDEAYEVFACRMSGQTWGIAFGNVVGGKLSYALTNAKHHNQVLSFVKDSILEFIEKKNPSVMTFEADKAGGKLQGARGNAYARLLDRFKPKGWSVVRQPAHIDGDDIFTIAKDPII
jgi:hypothetical protein